MTRQDYELCRSAIKRIEAELKEMKRIIGEKEEEEGESIMAFLERKKASRRLVNIMRYVAWEDETYTVKRFLARNSKQDFLRRRNCGIRTAGELERLLREDGYIWG